MTPTSTSSSLTSWSQSAGLSLSKYLIRSPFNHAFPHPQWCGPGMFGPRHRVEPIPIHTEPHQRMRCERLLDLVEATRGFGPATLLRAVECAGIKEVSIKIRHQNSRPANHPCHPPVQSGRASLGVSTPVRKPGSSAGNIA